MPTYRIPPPAGPPERGPVLPEQLLCGLAMSLTSGWQLEVLENTARIARNDLPLPLYLQHEDRAVTSSGFEPIPFGEWLKFRAVPGPG